MNSHQRLRVDCAVHPQPETSDELRRYMPEPWRSRAFPGPERYFYPAPNEYFRGSVGASGLPGSDPALLARHIFGDGHVDLAVLLPRTRGLNPDLDLANQICAATNDWLASKWLTESNEHGRYFGSIRINASDPAAAVAEIERWAGDPRMVQVAVTMQAHRPYGQRFYHPIWEAAAAQHMPVAVISDGSLGVEYFPSPVGYFRFHAEYSSFYPLNFYYHLSSLIAEGAFDRYPALRFVFVDGGSDLLMPFMWRLNNNWRASRAETPWVSRLPTDYLSRHVRFCTSRMEGPPDPAQSTVWAEVSDSPTLLMYASHYPYWLYATPLEAVSRSLPDDMRHRILGANALEIYRLSQAASAPR
jgi:uncharacterized protein